MYIAACIFDLHIPGAGSLKEKRSVVQSALTRVRNQFHVSIGEVDALDQWDLAIIGLAVVSNDAIHARQVAERILAFVERSRLDAEVGEASIEIVQPF
jgi:uncharacterized protein YlxP (DUF503 family)